MNLESQSKYHLNSITFEFHSIHSIIFYDNLQLLESLHHNLHVSEQKYNSLK